MIKNMIKIHRILISLILLLHFSCSSNIRVLHFESEKVDNLRVGMTDKEIEDLYETIHKIILKLNGVIYIRGKIIDSVEKDEEEPLFNLARYEREFKTKEEVALVREIEKELSSSEKDISDLCDEYETALSELLSTLVTKAAGLKKELIS